jgi:tRNA A-37 threonylcarbamoyl transferase component Bud32
MTADLYALSQLPSNEAFNQWLDVPGEWVEEPNVRRGGESGVKRIWTSDGHMLYRKQQAGHIHRTLLHPLGYPTAMRERRVLLDCKEIGVRVPELVYADCRKMNGQWQALLITHALDSFSSLEDCYARGDDLRWGEALHQQVLQEVGRTLARFNQDRWQHGCLRMKHLFVRVEDQQIEAALIDLEKSRRLLTKGRAARHDIAQLKRHSNWSDALWQSFLKGYEETFGSDFSKR